MENTQNTPEVQEVQNIQETKTMTFPDGQTFGKVTAVSTLLLFLSIGGRFISSEDIGYGMDQQLNLYYFENAAAVKDKDNFEVTYCNELQWKELVNLGMMLTEENLFEMTNFIQSVFNYSPQETEAEAEELESEN